MKDFAKSIRTGNSKEVTIIAPNGEKLKAIDYDQWHYKCVDTGELVEKRYSKVVGNSSVCNKAIVLKDGNVWVVLYANETKSQEFETEAEAREFAKKVGNSKVGNSKKTFSGKYIDIYDDGQIIIKDGWAFGERFNENNFRGWIAEQIRLQEHTLQTSKQMRSEFEKNI